ncbi:ATP-binding protein [Streptomyces durocortorensis]|uniref:histidine kinase n=1 Tax=Streptomyces durocortorensis TaxID=2811104 RepID=A0ABS2HQH5_9ACTN|nr:ATP-binding protein [Streptomyces durocortorensis]MBM7053334.1 ATP-binding protein [Streptomyces durocortorensis]
MSRPLRKPRRDPGASAAVAGWAFALPAAACAGWVTVTADAEWHRAVAGACAAAVVLLTALVLILIRRLSAERSHRAREAEVATARGTEVAHLAAVRVPAIAERLQTGQRLDGVPGPVASPEDTGEEFARALDSVVVALGSDTAVHRERALRDSVQAAFESVARTMHVMATVQQQVLDEVERSIEDPLLMANVMKADHAASQMTRKAQTLLVMCGIWPARRETRPVSLYDCVRGAQSRIVEFGRIEVHGGQTLYVVPPAVEGLMHSIAELLENATVFSPSSSPVVVSVREVGAGAVIEIDDAGLGMPPDVMHQALGQLRDDLDLTRLGAVPRLGLACTGRWSRELGFNVELSGSSAYGGTRAVMFVPFRLLTDPLPRPAAHRRPATEPAEQVGPVVPPAGVRDDASEPADAPMLPQRRSRRGAARPTTAARHSAPAPNPVVAPAEPWTPEAARASIASVVSGTLRGRAAVDADGGTGPASPPHGGQSLPSTPHKHAGGRP